MSRKSHPVLVELSFVQNDILFDYERFDNFIKAAEEMALAQDAKIIGDIIKWNETNPGHELNGFESQEEEYIRLSSYKILIDSAILISAYSNLEFHLNKICHSMSQVTNSKLVPEDFNGKGIDQSKKYLEKVFEIDFKSLKAHWELIQLFRYIRNRFVHNSGKIVPKEGGTLQNVEQYKKIIELNIGGVDDGGKIYLSKADIKIFLETSSTFLTKLVDFLADKHGAN